MPITHAQGTAQQPLSMQVSLSTPTFAVFHQDAPQRTIQLTREGRKKNDFNLRRSTDSTSLRSAVLDSHRSSSLSFYTAC